MNTWLAPLRFVQNRRITVFPPIFLTASRNPDTSPAAYKARKSLSHKDFRASFTLVPAGYIGTADSALAGDLPLGAGGLPIQTVAHGDNRPLPGG